MSDFFSEHGWRFFGLGKGEFVIREGDGGGGKEWGERGMKAGRIILLQFAAG